MKNKLKGMALIVVMMISTVILIMVGGLFTVIMTGTNLTSSNIDRTRLYYAAESGVNYGLYWLKSISLDSLNKKAVAPGVANGFNNQNLILTVNNATVKLTVFVDTVSSSIATVWRLNSAAELNGDSCIIQYRNIILRSPFDHCYFNNKVVSGGSITWFTKNQNFYGKTYFNGVIPLEWANGEMPTFYGEVESHYNTLSYANGGTGINFNDPLLASYKYGIKVQRTSGTMTNAAMLNSLNSDAFPFGYNQNVPAQPLQEMTYTWPQLINKTLFPASKKITDFPGMSATSVGIVEITFTEDSAGTAVTGASFIKVRNSSKTSYVRQNSNTKMICIPSTFGDVFVSGVVNSDISIITEADNVVVNGDLYSKGHEAFRDDDRSAFDGYTLANQSHPINQIINVNQQDYNIGIMVGMNTTGAPNLYVNQNGITGASDIILLTAGLFVPKGELRYYDKQPNLTATGIVDLSWTKYSKLITYGGFIGLTEGTTENSSTTQGFSPNYINSPKFIAGQLPPGFRPAVEQDPVTGLNRNLFSDGFDWSIRWK